MDDFGSLNLNDDNNAQDPMQNGSSDLANNLGNTSSTPSMQDDSMQSNSNVNTGSDTSMPAATDQVVPMSDDMQNMQNDLSAMNNLSQKNDQNGMNDQPAPNMNIEEDSQNQASDAEVSDDGKNVNDADAGTNMNSMDSAPDLSNRQDMPAVTDDVSTQTPMSSADGGSMQNDPSISTDIPGNDQAATPMPQQDSTQAVSNQNMNTQQVGGQMPQDNMSSGGMQPSQTQTPDQPMPQQVPPINVPPDKDPNVYRFLVDAIYAKHGTGVDVNFVTQEADRLYVQLGDLLVNSFEGDLNDQQKEEFNGLVSQGYQNEDLQGYLLQNITNLEQRIQEILIQFRNNYMAS